MCAEESALRFVNYCRGSVRSPLLVLPAGFVLGCRKILPMAAQIYEEAEELNNPLEDVDGIGLPSGLYGWHDLRLFWRKHD